MFQAAHGSAPDIAGKCIANPYGTVLSAASMLEWLAANHDDDRLAQAASRIRKAVSAAIEAGLVSRDLGGDSGSALITEALCERLR